MSTHARLYPLTYMLKNAECGDATSQMNTQKLDLAQTKSTIRDGYSTTLNTALSAHTAPTAYSAYTASD